MLTVNWKLESDVNDFVKEQLNNIGLKKHRDFNEESAMSDYMKESLKGSAKTDKKTNFGKPDFHIEKYVPEFNTPIIIEDKLGENKLFSGKIDSLLWKEKDIRNYACNGAVYYAQNMIRSGKYNQVIAIGVAGSDKENVRIAVYYVYGSGEFSYKFIKYFDNLNFLENKASFNEFFRNAVLSEEDKHKIIIRTKEQITNQAKKLNKLMHNLNITAPQRILYVSGMLLSMQEYYDKDGNYIKGLIPDDLKGKKVINGRDGDIIYNQINNFLINKNIPETKRALMLNSFSEIKKDSQRDDRVPLDEIDKTVSSFLKEDSTINKQIFTFIYNNIYQNIDGLGHNVDLIGELYSEFLKYSLGDGKEIGIVLTPPYVTKMMVDILDLDENSRVLDLATGSAGFLISAMNKLIELVVDKYGYQTAESKEKIEKIKTQQLLGVELNAEMYTLATTNMILRGDGSSKIEKGDAFNRPPEIYEKFKANRILLNPPFSYRENGLPFIEFGLDHMEKGGLGAIIIQDSAGNGKGIQTAQKILKKHTLLASIKMPSDLFEPSATVQTSIYIFEAHKPHDPEKTVKFIDFRNDGYKRTNRTIYEIDHPIERYSDLIKIYKAGKCAKINKNLIDIDKVYIEDLITLNGNDWNFDQHIKMDLTPTIDDFKRIVGEYLSFQVNKILKTN